MKTLRVIDLFCGAGGTSEGLRRACAARGVKLHLTVVNHWDVAINSHKLNHPDAEHLCTSVDDVKPSAIAAEDSVDILWASPECTHHSIARGGKPVNDQSRASAWCVTRFAAELRPKIIWVENVKEFEEWGPLIKVIRAVKVKGKYRWRRWHRSPNDDGCPPSGWRTRQRVTKRGVTVHDYQEPVVRRRKVLIPDPKRKGEIFQAWVAALRAIGYRVEWRILCAADYGAPTTRRRLIVYATYGRRRPIWPDATHAAPEKLVEAATSPDLFTTGSARALQPWRTARDHVIDWSDPGTSIFTRREQGKKDLVDKTLQRIWIGLQKFGFGAFTTSMQATNPEESRSVDEPFRTVTATSSDDALVQPFILPQQSGIPAASVDRPLNTVATEGAISICTPLLLDHRGRKSDRNRVKSANEPVGTVTAGGKQFSIIQPFLLPREGVHGGNAPRSVNDPAPTIVTQNGTHLVTPVLIKLRGANDAASIDKPAPTVCASGGHLGIANSFLVNMKGQSDGADVNHPAPTVTAHAPHLGVATPYLVQTNHGNDSKADSGERGRPGRSRRRPADDTAANARRVRPTTAPLPTVTGARGEWGVASPFLVNTAHKSGNGAGVRPVDSPVPTVTTQRSHGIAQPYVIAIDNKGGPQDAVAGGVHSAQDPLSTITTKQRHAVCNPFIVPFYGASEAVGVDDPLDTVTTKDRFGLVRPIVEIGGERYLLDIMFRMLNERELQRAQGFGDAYRFTGNKSQVVKQIGNAVPPEFSEALTLTALDHVL